MKKKLRNGSFLRDNNDLMGLLNLPFGRIMVIGVSQQTLVLTKDDARKYLGELTGSGRISFDTAARIQTQVECARLAQNMGELAKRVNQHRMPSWFGTNCNFKICRRCRLHGDLILNGMIVHENIDSFGGCAYMVCALVDLGRMKPTEAVSALKQVLKARLPLEERDSAGAITGLPVQLFDDALGGGHGLDDLLHSMEGRIPTDDSYTRKPDGSFYGREHYRPRSPDDSRDHDAPQRASDAGVSGSQQG